MAFPNNEYTEANVYTQTLFEAPTQAILSGLRFPVFVGTGSEILQTQNLEVIRGSSTFVDQEVVKEDATGRSVVSVLDSGDVVLGDFNGVRDRIQTRHFPIVDGRGTGTPATRSNAISITINGTPIVPLSFDAAKGIIKLSTPPQLGDDVRVTYFFKRTDTLFTDDVSAQVTADAPVLYGAIGQSYTIVEDDNDTLIFTVDDEDEVTVTITASSPGSPWSASQIAAFINAAASGTSLVASTYETNYGETAVTVTADRDIRVGNGTANSTIGFSNGESTGRNKTFYTFQGPIVDGSNGGVTTTSPSDVAVVVDGQAVTPTAVDGQTRAVTLPFAPKAGAKVEITYYQNTWQDTFDYLANINITEVIRAGDTPDRNDYIQGADFVLSDDKVLWGTAALVTTGEHTDGTEFFGASQISTTLVDVRQYLAPCDAVVNTAVNPPVQSRTSFTLPLVPTTGNGRSTPLGENLYASVSNGRIDLPTNRPDLVTAYWGFNVQDAIERGAVAVSKVDSATATITLAEPVPPGAMVFATFYYNTLGDQDYTFTVDTPGAAGVGTYTIQDENGNDVLTPLWTSKSAGLTGITVQFPSGSERTPDLRFESPFSTTAFTGPVEEDVTVTFAAKDGTLGFYTPQFAGPFDFITGSSDHFRLLVDGSDLNVGATGIDLSNLSGVSGLGFHAVLVSDEVVYDSTNNYTDYDIDATNNLFDVTLDGVLIQAAAEVATTSVAGYVAAINRAARGEAGTATAGGASTITLAAGASALDDLYTGWTIRIIGGTGAGQEATIDDYVGATKVATVDAAWATPPDATSQYIVFNADHQPRYVAGSRFTSPVTIVAGEYDTFGIHYTGDVSGASGPAYATIAPGTYNSASQLATAMQTAIDEAASLFGSGVAHVEVEATVNSELAFRLLRSPADGNGMIEFISVDGAEAAVNSITINDTSLTLADQFDIAGIPLVGVAGARTPGSDDFRIDGTAGAGTPASIASEIAAAINDGANSFAGTVTATATDDVVTLTLVATGSAGNAQTLVATLTDATDADIGAATFFGGADGAESDFSLMAGISAASATQGKQAKLIDGIVARRFSDPGDNTSSLMNDRIVLRNRLVPGIGDYARGTFDSTATVVVGGGSGNAQCGFSTSDTAHGAIQATSRPATVLGRVGLADGQGTGYGDARDSQPVVTFYAAGGTEPQNNVFKFTFEGTPVTVEFTDDAGAAIVSGASADVPLGPASTANTVLNQIATAMANAGIAASAAAVLSAGLLLQEGLGLRLVAISPVSTSSIVIGTGSANATLGFTGGAEYRSSQVDVDVLASALLSENGGGAFDANTLLSWDTPGAWAGSVTFAEAALAYKTTDAGGAEYLTIQSQGDAGRGTLSSIAVAAASADNVYLQGSGFEVTAGEGGSGEDGISGYYVTSSDPADGSGSINTSVLNSSVTGEGQDGVVGQTYRDAVTGLTFTILPREGGTNYPDGETVTFSVRRVVTTDSNLPIRTIPGAEVLVTDTRGVGVGDTAIVSTYERGGQEPGIGDSYYITYNYRKDDFGTRLFTDIRAIEAEYGENSPENPVTLASYMAFENGAVLVGVKQTEKDVDEDGDGVFDTATTSSYIDAVNDLEGALPGGTLLNYIVPVALPSTDTASFFNFLARHCDIQSTIRRRAERTAICGFPAGTLPRTAGEIAQAVGRSRLRVVYPDIVTLSLDQADGTSEQFLVDGSFLAAALAGVISAPRRDVATPWTGLRIFGFDNLARVMDAVEMNQTAVRGVTVLEDRPSYIRVRQGFTTEMTNILTKTPTVYTIADYVQQQTRLALEQFIGVKFLPGILSQIEGRLANVLKLLVQAEILTAYTGVKANVAGDDPTVAEVQAWYQPVFPLLYIIVTFNLRSSL